MVVGASVVVELGAIVVVELGAIVVVVFASGAEVVVGTTIDALSVVASFAKRTEMEK